MARSYKIGMIGFGSIGLRHVKNIVEVLNNRSIAFTIDLIRRKDSKPLTEEMSSLVSNVYTDFEHVSDDYDIMFITNPTHLHFDSIKKYLSKTKNMFIEKPVFDNSNIDLQSLALNPNGIYYVACPLRYTEVIQYAKKNIDLNEVYSARAISSSYLPDWRPNVDYRETYSAHQDQGGGVSIDLIHEWDYLMYLFGKPKKISNFRGQYSALEIDSDDLSVYIAEYETMLAEVHLDYFGRKPIRELQLFTPSDTIIIDILKSEVRFLTEDKVISFESDRNAYQLKEIENFFDILEGKSINENDLQTALTTLKIAKDGNLI